MPILAFPLGELSTNMLMTPTNVRLALEAIPFVRTDVRFWG
jgi:hypothetical protein